MTQYRFEYLISLYKTGALSRDEWDELREAIRTGEHADLLRDDVRHVLEAGGMDDGWSPAVEEQMWAAIQQGKDKGIVPGKGVVQGDGVDQDNLVVRMRPRTEKRVTRGVLLRWSVVAAAMLISGVSMWWLLRPQARSVVKPVMAAAVAEVKPGGNKAVLTLANGQQIVLDSSANGQIAQQGGARIIKLNGLVSYKNAGAKGQEESLYNTISTPRGGQYELILPDGSHVWLNSASVLRFPTAFNGNRREVELQGEGFFEIAKDAKRPFVLDVNHMKVRVLGTSFNTMAYSEEGTVNTTLVDGAVSIEEGQAQQVLQPGQQACLGNGSQDLVVRKADVRQVTAWRSGLFEFDNTDLRSIMRQVARWYDIEVVYKVVPDKAPLGGTISRALNLHEVLALLESAGINHFTIEGKKVFVLP